LWQGPSPHGYGASSNREDERSPFGEDCQAYGVQKLVNAAAKTWRRLKGENQLPKVVQGIKFQNGIEVIKMSLLTTPPDRSRHPISRIARAAENSARR
jgi:hypothetical protein